MAENISKIQLNGTVYTIGNETTTAVTSASTDNEIPTAKAVYDAIPQGGGGKAVSGGTNISITTGETADTINCTLNASNGSGAHSFREGWGTYANKRCAHAEGEQTTAGGSYSHAEGYLTSANGDYSHTEGYQTKANNNYEHSSGQYNVSNTGSTTFGNGGNTLFSVGNGTSNSARHNAFEIRQNGDIYITKDGQDVKLQDQLGGGGGSSYTAGDGIDITNDVISVTGKLDTSAITTSVTSASTDAQVPSAKAVYDAIPQGGGLKKWEGTRAEYNALSTYDTDTLYIITDEDVEIPTVPTKVSAFENDAGYALKSNSEEITFTLEDGSTVTKKFILG